MHGQDNTGGEHQQLYSDHRQTAIPTGWMEQRITSEPCMKPGKNHVVINIDGGPRVVSFIVNGHFCDGGEYRQFGWQRFSPYFRHVNWSERWTVSNVDQLKVYNRILSPA
jgi:hypothetical protein